MNKLIYFDNAATTFPKPVCVQNAVNNVMLDYCANPGRSSHELSMRAAKSVFAAREKVALLFGGKEENVVFTLNATYVINLALKSLLKKGDHVLISDIEHNAVLRPIHTMAENGVISYDVYTAYRDPAAQLRELEKKVKSNTALICACHHSNISNFVLPIASIGRFCRYKGILFLVDASQSAGTLPINVTGDCIDVLCAPAHKGLYGIPGCGFALFNHSLSDCSRISTYIEGGNGVSSALPYMPDLLPERLEAGTLPLPAICSLEAGIDFIQKISQKQILEKETSICHYLRKGLRNFNSVTVHSDTDGPILLFSVKDIPSEEIAARLDSQKICVRAGLHCAPLAHKKLKTPESGAVRISLGAFNTLEQAEYFLWALRKSIRKR